MWTKENEQFLIDNFSKISQVEIERAINKSSSQVQYKIKQLKGIGLIPYDEKYYAFLCEKYGEKNLDFVKSFYPKYGSNLCSSKTGLSVRKIQNIVVALGLRVTYTEATITGDNFYYFDCSLFEAPTAEFAYILGFVWGDGHIKGNRIACSNLRVDVQSIASVFFKTGKWNITDLASGNSDGSTRREQACLYIQDDKLSDFLISHQYDVKKDSSPNTILAFLPPSLRKYWWRGFFDADGHLLFRAKANLSIDRLTFSLASSYEQDWSFVRNLFIELKIDDYQIFQHISKKGHKQSAVRTSNRVSILRFMNYIYDGYDYIGLPRKYMAYLGLANNLINRALRTSTPHQHEIELSGADWAALNKNFGNMTKNLISDILQTGKDIPVNP